MKKVILCSLFALVAASTSFSQILLSVDMGASWGSGVQSGFSGMNESSMSGNNASATFGGITFSITTGGSAGFFATSAGTNGGAYTYQDLYSGNFYNNASDPGSAFTFTLSGVGITAGGSYTLELFCFDSGHSGTTTFTPFNGTAGSAGSVTYVGSVAPTANDQYSTLLNVVADGSGVISIDITGGGLTPGDPSTRRMNGLVLTAVPEPSTAVMFAAGSTIMLASARRRRSS